MLRSVGKFAKDRKGAFAMQFALMAIPLTVCTGLSIDGGRAFLAHYELASALDAAALAIGSNVDPNTDLDAVAQKFVDANFHGEHDGPIVLDLQQVQDADETIILKGEVTINTYFMPIVGQPTVTVSAESVARRGGNNVEVTLALDVTESMGSDSDPTSRISTLRVAAADLIDTVVSDSQPPAAPFYSRVAIVPWANNVYAGSYAGNIRGPVTGSKDITAATWRDGSANNISAATWKDGASKAMSGATRASQAVITSSAHGFANGDYIYISGVSGMTQLNNKRYKVSDVTTDTFKIKNADTGSYISSSSYSSYTSGGTIQKCFTQTCEVQITTSTSHGLAAGDYVWVTGVGGMTGINNSGTTNWPIASVPTSTTAILQGSNGPGYSSYTSGGTEQKCFNSTCAVQVTSSGHGLSNGQYVQISGVVGMTSLNQSGNTSWPVESVTSSTYLLTGSTGPNYSNYTSGGAGQCLTQGCAKYRFTNASGSISIRPISDCISERVGAHQYDDVAPSTTYAGRDYAGTGAYVRCETANQVLPLTADKGVLKAKIAADTGMQLTGATAGQIGAAWGWYMISPDWGYLWPDAESKPGPYSQKDLKKVVVLMTDGEFNTAHCNGVVSSNYGVSNNTDRGNCAATNGDPFVQADSVCDGMKAAGVIVYTVGFEVTAGGSADNFLEACATDSDHYYLANSSDELKKAFKQIATSISMLRIAR